LQNFGQMMPRERKRMSHNVIASAAILPRKAAGQVVEGEVAKDGWCKAFALAD
jgi:hypothetical protein